MTSEKGTKILPFLKAARAARLEASRKATKRHRGQAQATAALRLATTRLLTAELRRDRPRKAGRFLPTQPAPAGDDLFAGA